MATRNVRLSLTCASRDDAEVMLGRGAADLGICQARNRSVGNEMEGGRSAPLIWIFTPRKCFSGRMRRRCRLDLSLVPQVVMHPASDEPVARRLQISGHTIFTNELRRCAACWRKGAAGDFCRRIFRRRDGQNVKRLHTEVGSQIVVRRW